MRSGTKKRSMRFALRTLLPAILLASAVLACNAATYYVSTDGNNSNPGTAQFPWRSIDAGDTSGALHPGDVVVVKEGVYVLEDDASINLAKCSGTKDNPITYKSEGLVVIQGDTDSESVGFQVSASYTTITGFRIRSLRCGIGLAAGTHGNTISYCSISDVSAAGVHDQGGKGNLLHHNLLYCGGLESDNGSSACVLASGCEDLKVFNNTMASFGTGILAENTTAGAVEAVNNIIFGMRTFGLGSSNSEPGSIANSNNVFHENAADTDGTVVLGEASKVADPEFRNIEGHDYQVQPSSVAIDAGKNVGLVFEGSAPDIGAFETASMSAASTDGADADGDQPAPKPGLVALGTVTLTYYVSTSGNDSNNGLSTSTPWLTINRGDALKILRPGDTVVVAEGTYTGSGTYGVQLANCSGTATSPIKYTGYGAVVIDRDAWHNPAAGNDTLAIGITIGTSYTIVDNFEIINSQWGVLSDGYTQGNQITNCRIHAMSRPNTTAGNGWYGWCGGVYGSVTSNLTVRNCAIYSIGSADSTNDAACVSCTASSNVKTYNNTMAYARCGVYAYTNCGSYTIQNNIFTNMRSEAISSSCAGMSGLVKNYNMYYDNAANFGSGVTAGTPEYFNMNPKFGVYYALRAGSPAINAGTDLGYSYNGSAPDLGAYETGYTSATTYYVKPAASGGNDNNTGTSLATAWATISNGDATGVLNAGDTVIVAAGTYAQSSATGVVLSNCSGNPSHPITYKANGTVVIDQTSYAGGASYGFDVGVGYIVLDGFEVTKTQYGVHLLGASGNAATGCEIKNCKIHDILPADSGSEDMWSSMSAGIYDHYNGGNTFHNNVIYNVGTPHLVPTVGNNNFAFCIGGPGTSNDKVYNNTLVHAWAGIMSWVAGTGNEARNNIFYDDWGYGLYNATAADCWTNSNNLYYANGANYGGYASAGSNEQTANPVFVNPGSYDYHLQVTSPAIDAGTDLGLGWTYYGTAPDEGAYEYDSRTTYYVKTNGNDALDGKSLANAWLTINRGDVLGVLKAGDTVQVQAGTYTGSGTYGVQFSNCSGNPTAPITYSANGTVVIDRDAYHNPAAGNDVAAYGITFNANYTVVDGFEVKNAQWGIVDHDGQTGNQVIRCKIHDVTPPNTTADNSSPYGWCGGIQVWNSTNFVVRNCGFYNIGDPASSNDASCLEAFGGTNIKVHNNTCAGGRFGLHGAAYSTYNVDVKNNIFSDARSTAITSYFAGMPGFVHTYNLFWNNPTNYGTYISTGQREFVGNPRYTNAGTYNYQLLAGSPAINAGTNLGYTYSGPAPDLGAYETNYATSATTYYVKPAASGGSDANNGTSLATAWATIGRGDALGVLNPGDTVIVAAGTYAQGSSNGVTLANCYGSPTAPITYQANGSVVINQSGYTGALGFDVGVSYVVLDGFEVCNAQYGVRLVGTGGNTVTGCVVKNCKIHDMVPVSPDGTDMWASMSAGIYCYYGNDNTFDHNVIYNVGQPHLVPNNGYGNNNLAFCIGGPGCSNTKVYNNTLVHGLFGLFGWGSSYGNQFRNNIAYENWGWGLYTSDSADYWTNSYNLYYSTHGGSYTTYGGYSSAGPNEQTVDPVFVNPGSYDYHLQSTSPAIDAGTDVGLIYTGLAPDMGAYETTSATGNIYYVAITGNDANSGTAASPWRTINRGDVLGVLKPGDTVIVSPGTYTQADYVGVALTNCSGSVSQSITYRANGAVVVDQTGIPKPTRMSFGFYVNKNYITIDGFEVKGSQWGVYFEGGAGNTVMNCVLHDLIPGDASAGDWFGFCGGVYFSASSSGAAHHNVTYNIGTSNVDKIAAGICLPGCTNINVYNNTCVNSWSGLAIWGSGSSNIQAVNNAFTNNWKYGMWNNDVTGCLTHTNNIFYSNTTSDYVGNVSAAAGEFNADPLYANYATRDLRLQGGSPAIDAGLNIGLSYMGASPDLGAYENPTSAVHNWVVANFEGTASTARPFSFRYGGTNSSSLLPNWTYSYSAAILDSSRYQRTNTYTSTDGKLQVKCVSIEYSDFPAVEWLVYFKNIAGSGDTSIIDQIYGCNMVTSGCSTTGSFTVYGGHGGENVAYGFQPWSNTLSASSSLGYAPVNYISSNGILPFFNFVKPNNTQMLIGLGWSGGWETVFTRDAGYNVTVKTGLYSAGVILKLLPGEEIRTPFTTVLYTSGTDRMVGQNAWRKLLLAHYSPTVDGMPYNAPIAASLGSDAEVNAIANNNLPVNTAYMDAGWYTYTGAPLDWVGNYTPDPTRYPNGLAPIGEAAHAAGMKYLLWFELEKCCPDTEFWALCQTAGHDGWLLASDDYGYGPYKLINFGNPACLQWMKDNIPPKYLAWKADILRTDHNTMVGPFWEDNKVADRWGILENMHIQGLYSFYDYMKTQIPGFMIDNCAGGGRRLDLEMMKRSVCMWRCDHCWDDPSTQANELGLAMWYPITGNGTDRALTRYHVRSGFGNNYVMALPWTEMNGPTYAWVNRVLSDLLDNKDCYYGDFYPLTDYSIAEDVWMAWQFYRPDTGRGVVQAFRRKYSAATSATYYLKGLDPSKQYVVTNVDTGVSLLKTGSQLMSSGVTFSLPTLEQVFSSGNWYDVGASAMITYQRQ